MIHENEGNLNVMEDLEGKVAASKTGCTKYLQQETKQVLKSTLQCTTRQYIHAMGLLANDGKLPGCFGNACL